MTRNPPKGSLRRYPRRRRSGPSAIIIILLLCRLFGRRISTREASLICIKANAICHFGINKNGVHKQTTTMTSHANLYAHARARGAIFFLSLSLKFLVVRWMQAGLLPQTGPAALGRHVRAQHKSRSGFEWRTTLSCGSNHHSRFCAGAYCMGRHREGLQRVRSPFRKK